MVWDVDRPRSRADSSPIIASYDKPRLVLCGHGDAVTCVAVRSEVDLVVSGSADSTIIMYTLSRGRFLRSFPLPSRGSDRPSSMTGQSFGSTAGRTSSSSGSSSGTLSSGSGRLGGVVGSPVKRLVVTPQGTVIAYSELGLSLHAFSINGWHLASVDLTERVRALATSSCGDFVVTGGGTYGTITVRLAATLELVRKFDSDRSVPISSVAVTEEECLLVGLEGGQLMTYSVEQGQIKRGISHYNLT